MLKAAVPKAMPATEAMVHVGHLRATIIPVSPCTLHSLLRL